MINNVKIEKVGLVKLLLENNRIKGKKSINNRDTPQ